MTETFDFALAVRTCTPMITALAGASGTGKTFTALELVMGLIERPLAADSNGKALLIDTEGRRGLHYADLLLPNGEKRFAFDHCDLRAPYSPARFLGVLKQAEAARYAAIIVDSASDEYVGEGGLVDMAQAEADAYREKNRGREMNTAATWAKPKAQHKTVIRWLRQSRCHLIFCIRAEEKVKLEQVEENGRKVTKVVPIGWQPICEKNFMYDMTASFMFWPDKPGVPHPIKLQEQHRRFFPAGEPITRDAGRLLAEWCAGGASAPVGETLYRDGQMAALRGRDEFRKWWRAQGSNTELLTDAQVDALKAAAESADQQGDPMRPISTPSPSQIREPAASLEDESAAGKGSDTFGRHEPL